MRVQGKLRGNITTAGEDRRRRVRGNKGYEPSGEAIAKDHSDAIRVRENLRDKSPRRSKLKING